MLAKEKYYFRGGQLQPKLEEKVKALPPMSIGGSIGRLALAARRRAHSPLVFLIAGEPSGDAIGAKLMQELRRQVAHPALPHCRIAALAHCRIAALPHCRIAASPQRRSAASPQRRSAAAPQRRSAAAPHRRIATAPPHRRRAAAPPPRSPSRAHPSLSPRSTHRRFVSRAWAASACRYDFLTLTHFPHMSHPSFAIHHLHFSCSARASARTSQ